MPCIVYDFNTNGSSPGSGNQTGKLIKMQDASGVQDFHYGNLGEMTRAVNTATGEETVFQWDANGNMTKRNSEELPVPRWHCWDEENRLMGVSDHENISGYIYNAGGERVWKLHGPMEDVSQSGQPALYVGHMHYKTLYANPYLVINDAHYTKHYYMDERRITSKIGSGFEDAPIDPLGYQLDQVAESPYGGDYYGFGEGLWNMLERTFFCLDMEPDNVIFDGDFPGIHEFAYEYGPEEERYFYHSDHLGSSTFITDAAGELYQFLQYLPFGEPFVSQHVNMDGWATLYTFSAKEQDAETGYHYFGARYYDSELSVWLSVDPMSDIYPSLSPYTYCNNNPVIFFDPNGMWFKIIHKKGASEKDIKADREAVGGLIQGVFANVKGIDGIDSESFNIEMVGTDASESWDNKAETLIIFENEDKAREAAEVLIDAFNDLGGKRNPGGLSQGEVDKKLEVARAIALIDVILSDHNPIIEPKEGLSETFKFPLNIRFNYFTEAEVRESKNQRKDGFFYRYGKMGAFNLNEKSTPENYKFQKELNWFFYVRGARPRFNRRDNLRK